MAAKICAVGLISAVCLLLLREVGWRGAPIFAAVASLAIIGFVLPEIKDMSEGLASALDLVGATETARSVIKIVGLSYLFGISADVCREVGSDRIASAVILAGRIEIALVAVPYVIQMLKLGMELM